MPEDITIGVLLNRLADILDERFGPHPTVPMDQLLPIAEEMVNAADDVADKPAVLTAITAVIKSAYEEEGLPPT